MYAVTLYIFHRASDNFNALIYHYALDIGEAESFPCYSSKINGKRRWELLSFRSIMTREDINKFLEAFNSTSKYVVEGKLIQASEWAVRPTIYVLGRSEHGEGIKSLTNRTCRGRVYYALEKTAFQERLFPPGEMEKEQAKDDMKKLESWVLKDIGIQLLSNDSDRFGNMEIYDNLDSSSLLESFGLRIIKSYHYSLWRRRRYFYV